MDWTIDYKASAIRQLKKLDQQAAKRITSYLEVALQKTNDPRSSGKALKGISGNQWRYRIGDYRVICNIQDKHLTVLVLKLGHRKDIYN